MPDGSQLVSSRLMPILWCFDRAGDTLIAGNEEMIAGEAIDDVGRQRIDRAIRDAETISGYKFSVYIGAAEGDAHAFANHLHSALTAPERSVLIMVDPVARTLEVVTGKDARRVLTNTEAALAVLAMQSDFAVAGLASGIVRGLHQLAEQARM